MRLAQLRGRIAFMTPWLPAALAYVSSWLDFQRRHHDQPGVAIAIASGGEIVLEAAFGSADLATGEVLTPRHGFRIARIPRASPRPASCASSRKGRCASTTRSAR
jgi:CubicO group peptidase (beta-lactamase class C family)